MVILPRLRKPPLGILQEPVAVAAVAAAAAAEDSSVAAGDAEVPAPLLVVVAAAAAAVSVAAAALAAAAHCRPPSNRLKGKDRRNRSGNRHETDEAGEVEITD